MGNTTVFIGNLATNINLAVPAFGVTEQDVLISYLPLSHVFQRHVDYAFLTIGAVLARSQMNQHEQVPPRDYVPLALAKLLVHPLLVWAVGTAAIIRRRALAR